jgi:glycosyltransferase involved in cell wall biosynthesis
VPTVRILIFHGYLLRGTGSNVYNASLTQALASQGHEVHLFCQDRRADELEWVRDNDNITVHVPDIGGLLPVFVLDRYEGFEVKTFPDLTDGELDRYLDANVNAVREVVERSGPFDAALANHLIMGPVILARASLRFAIKVHGSDLSYTVAPHRDRFVPYAREGTDAAAGILAGSSHTARALFETVPDPGLPERTRLGPPGVDVHRFRPHPDEEALRDLANLAGDLAAEEPDDPEESEDSFGRNGPALADALRAWGEGDARALFVGKLLVSKGVDLLAAAWPLVHRDRVAAGAAAPRLLFIGFGAFERGLRTLIDALGRGDLHAARDVAESGRGLEGGDDAPLPILSGFLADPPSGYAEAAQAASGSMLIGGRLEHDEVADVMPAAHTFAMPSTWPEAFGMVPAESAACGAPPTAADHSGMREVAQLLAEAVPPDLARLLSFPVGPDAITELADRLEGWLGLEPDRRHEAGVALSRRVDELWSWEGVARTVIAASQGDLEGLPPVVA